MECVTGHSVYMLSAEDVASVCALEQECFTMPWTEAQICSAFMQKNYLAMGIGSPAHLLGYISCFHAGQELEILNIAIATAHRRQGLGEQLLRQTLRTAKKMSMQRAVLEVREHNHAAKALYAKLGFTIVGKRPRYYADTGEDGYIYALIL